MLGNCGKNSVWPDPLEPRVWSILVPQLLAVNAPGEDYDVDVEHVCEDHDLEVSSPPSEGSACSCGEVPLDMAIPEGMAGQRSR